jgi:hypothetical protein
MKAWLRNWFDRYGGARNYFSSSAVPDLDAHVVANLAQRDLDEGLHRERLLYALVMLVEWRASARRRRRGTDKRSVPAARESGGMKIRECGSLRTRCQKDQRADGTARSAWRGFPCGEVR